jgi:hypothetical protein
MQSIHVQDFIFGFPLIWPLVAGRYLAQSMRKAQARLPATSGEWILRTSRMRKWSRPLQRTRSNSPDVS